MLINEIFYSLQGEGRWSGTPAVFVRFSGCNLNCPFCDTDHQNGSNFSTNDIIREILKYPTHHVIFTGGEPTLQLNIDLLAELNRLGKYIHIETNGSLPLSPDILAAIDWITVSPKNTPLAIQRIDELKLLYHGVGQDISLYDNIAITYPDCRYLQPCDTGNNSENARILAHTIQYILTHPQWKLSLQTHKLLGIR